MSKNKGNTNTARSYAEEGLEEVSSLTTEAEANVASNNNTTDNDELQQVGGLEPIAFFYRTTAPKKPGKSAFKIIEKGQTINGTYERTFTGGRFNNPTYVVRLEDGQLAGLAGCGSLNKAMSKLAEGSKVKITYDGMRTIQGGEWEGTDSHVYTVFGNKFRA